MSLELYHLTEYFGNFSEFQFPLKVLPSPPFLIRISPANCVTFHKVPSTWLSAQYFTDTVDLLLTGQHVLEFDGINRKDAGTYNVTASNKYGDEQIPCTLMVTENPQEAEDWAAQLKKTWVLGLFFIFGGH